MRPFAAGRELLPGIVVLEHLARSRRLDVYDAWSVDRACRVAVKVLRPDHRANRRHVAALVREGRTLRRLGHPHLVRAFEVHAAPLAAVVLETLPGATLEHVAAEEPLEEAELRVLAAQVASGLHAIHAAGLLHLDLKPANVIVGAGRATLIDLSHARAAGRVPADHGTWCFAAPEQVAGGTVDTATDAWGLGITLHAAATGRSVLADRADDLDVDDPQLHGPLPSLAGERPDLSPELVATVDGWLRPDPAERPPSDALLVPPDAVGARTARPSRVTRRTRAPTGPRAAA